MAYVNICLGLLFVAPRNPASKKRQTKPWTPTSWNVVVHCDCTVFSLCTNETTVAEGKTLKSVSRPVEWQFSRRDTLLAGVLDPWCIERSLTVRVMVRAKATTQATINVFLSAVSVVVSGWQRGCCGGKAILLFHAGWHTVLYLLIKKNQNNERNVSSCG